MKRSLFSMLLAVVLSLPLNAQPRPQDMVGNIPSGQGGIVWHGKLREGLAEAKRTNRPILLLSAVPHCHGVSGVW